MPAKAKAAEIVGGDVRAPASTRSLAAFAVKMGDKYNKKTPKLSNGGSSVIVPTGSFKLDWALRVGGYQLGRVYEIVGPPDSAKTTLAIASMVSFSKMFSDRGVCYVDMENTFDPDRAMAMGLDCSDDALKSGRWAHLFPEHSEDVSDMARDYCNSGLYSVVVVDSIGAMESLKVLDNEAAKDSMGKNAQVITKMGKALSMQARLRQCTVLLINQLRANLSGMGADISAGPKHMRHATTVKIAMKALGDPKTDLRSLKLPGDTDPSVVSQQFAARVSRAKNTVPGREARFFVNKTETDDFGPPGIDSAGEYLELGVAQKIITLGGSWYNFPDGERRQGRAAAGRYLRENPDAFKAIREGVSFEAPIEDLDDTEES